jgi:ArsR family transcriptional regulator, arsenate/arsenite/antimonite-responsive transcriptional repressor / arsenate reductase (thioredoxin)
VSRAETDRGAEPPRFLGLVGHPLRWRLLAELALSDRRVGELCALVDAPQSLVSYHLGRLRSERMVFSRRSTADGRDNYYVADLERYRQLLSDTAVALHPGLRVQAAAPLDWSRRKQDRVRVLFLCTGNSARSQIAEALTSHLSGGAVHAVSAGSNPKPLHPNAVRVLAERGVDIADRESKHLDHFTSEQFEYVVSLCDRVREVCPEFPGHPDAIHWSVPDPSREGEDDASYPAFTRTLAEIETRVGFLLQRMYGRAEAGR